LPIPVFNVREDDSGVCFQDKRGYMISRIIANKPIIDTALDLGFGYWSARCKKKQAWINAFLMGSKKWTN
jgi:hypothetical protein